MPSNYDLEVGIEDLRVLTSEMRRDARRKGWGSLRALANRVISMAKELETLRKLVSEEYRILSGDGVDDFNDVWGGAGPDMRTAPQLSLGRAA